MVVKKVNVTKLLNRMADLVELVIAFVLIAAVLYLLAELIVQYAVNAATGRSFDFSDLLARTLHLIIGLEFTRMLCRHRADTIIDVLLFATARQLIVAHESPLGSFLGILSIAVLFLLRKYLLPAEPGEDGVLLHRLRLRGKKEETTAPSTQEAGKE